MAEPAKKPGLMLAIGLGKKKPAESVAGESAEAETSAFDDAFDAFKSAMDAGDDESAKAAFKEAVMACQDDY